MKRLHELYDIYNEYDGINNLATVNKNAGVAPVSVDGDIVDMLLFLREGYDITGGAVNAAMGPVLKIWHDYRRKGTDFPETAELPPVELLKEASRNTDIGGLIIDKEKGTVFLAEPGMSLDVGAAAKAYAEKLALIRAKEAGLKYAVISAGGNVTAVGRPPDGEREYWNVGVQDPLLDPGDVQNTADVVFINDKTMAVSGGYQRYYEVDGKAYHHIIDPGTLMPAGLYRQVAVIHEDPAMADLLSTALFILPYERGRELAGAHNAEALWIDGNGEWLYTDGYAEVSRELSG